jgi:hypothetical protein
MAISYKKYIFPEVDKAGGRPLAKVTDLSGDLMKSVNAYFAKENLHDTQGVALPGLSKAVDLLKAAKKDAGTNELTVKGGLDGKGDLIISVTGILPGPKPYEKFAIVRPGFAKVVEEMKTESHAVVNLQKGDGAVDKSAADLAKGFKTTAQTPDAADFGGITTGNVVMTAHGTPGKVSGILIGKELGSRTPEQIVQLLTAGTDKKKNLSKAFSGTVMLVGCYTASGTGAVPPGYDYSTFAGKVLQLLRAKGYSKCNVKGMPGEAVVSNDGTKTTVAVDHDTTLDAQDDANLIDNLSGTFGAKKR